MEQKPATQFRAYLLEYKQLIMTVDNLPKPSENQTNL